MPASTHETDEEKEARYVTESPDQLSVAERTEDGEDGESGNGRNGKGRGCAESDGEGEDESEAGGRGDGEGHGGEYDDDEEEEEEDDEDEDDDEPALKYERLGGSVHDLLQKDSASALGYAQQRLVRRPPSLVEGLTHRLVQALGTHAGIIHVLDMQGERIKSVKPHSASILDISLDETGDFVATASMDGEQPPRTLRRPTDRTPQDRSSSTRSPRPRCTTLTRSGRCTPSPSSPALRSGARARSSVAARQGTSSCARRAGSGTRRLCCTAARGRYGRSGGGGSSLRGRTTW